MAFTRKWLEALGVEAATIDSIIEEHTAITNRLQVELETAKGNADKLPNVQKELDDLKKADYKGKYEAEKSEHDALKASIESEKQKSAKESALKAYFEGKNIKDSNLKIAMRGVSLDSIELDGENIKDTTALDELVSGDFKGLVSSGDSGKSSTKQKVIDSGAKNGQNDSGGKQNYSLAAALSERYTND